MLGVSGCEQRVNGVVIVFVGDPALYREGSGRDRCRLQEIGPTTKYVTLLAALVRTVLRQFQMALAVQTFAWEVEGRNNTLLNSQRSAYCDRYESTSVPTRPDSVTRLGS